MIFQDLILQNFGPYCDRHTINLQPTPNQPIILFGGLNGGGKTTLMDAIRLALYGHRAQCSTRGTLAYADFLNQCINTSLRREMVSEMVGSEKTRQNPKSKIQNSDDALRSANASYASLTHITLSLSHTLHHTPTEIQIHRTWSRLPKNGRDTLEIFVNGDQDAALTQTWDEHIEFLLPLGISNLFLFDGEQVKELADDLTLPTTVVQAIRTLLGLELPDRLSRDLDILVTRKQKVLLEHHDPAKFADIEQALLTHEADKKDAHQQLAALKPKFERAQEDLRLAQDTFLAEGGKIATQEQQLIATLHQLEQQHITYQEQLRELAGGVLPLAMVRSLLTQAQTQAQTEIRHQQFDAAKDLIQSQNQALLNFIQNEPFSIAQIEQIQTFLTQHYAHLSQSPSAYCLGMTTAHLQRLSHILDSQLPEQGQTATHAIAALHSTQTQRNDLERQLAQVGTQEVVDTLSQQVRDAQDIITTLQTDMEQAQRHYDQAKLAIERTKKDLASYSQLVIDFKNEHHKLDEIARVKTTLKRFQQRLKLHKLNHLETLITECFLYLLHKSNLVHQVEIDTETFSLSLYDHDGEPIPKHRLSAGEKQLLAIALLWGLARASGRHLPVAIDTPLGRLDSKHRYNLVERYFPQASHQVILLSTDTEIRDKEVGMLREQGAIAREYLLKYNHDQRSSAITTGYFW